MRELAPKLLSWASEIDENTIDQAAMAARLPIVEGHIALMPDAHLGIGATVGSVIPTKDSIIPAAVGVDVGCGVLGVQTDLHANDLPDSLDAYLRQVETLIPAGMGKGHAEVSSFALSTLGQLGKPATELTDRQEQTIAQQFGTLGSGNHFFEVCLDEDEQVWLLLHSGSRGIGNQLASAHIKIAKSLATPDVLEDPNLAYLVQGTPEFERYIADLLWAQAYAFESRGYMMDNALRAFFAVVGTGREVARINNHHNFAQQEEHGGQTLWITRKGAIKADVDDYGVIPGSMATGSYIVRGKGNPLSWKSCSHGAGRRMSRTRARKELTVESLVEQMGDRAWLKGSADTLLDEHPDSYKDIKSVMADQEDLVEVVAVLRQVLNFKGV